MFLKRVGFYVLLALGVCVRSQYSTECPVSCVRVDHCQAAQELLVRDDYSRNRVKDAFCGRDVHQQVLVCCEKLFADLDQHPNLRLLPDECGHGPGKRIVGGQEAALQEFPWMVLLSYKYRGDLDFQCGGTLINDRYVLTAAHCISNLGRRVLVGVRVGEHNILTATDCQLTGELKICQDHIQDIGIGQLIPHEQYNGNPGELRNDIGLIRLSRKVDLNHDNVGLVCLPRNRELRVSPLAGTNATVTGWGATESERKSNFLQKVYLRVHTEDACSAFYDRGNSDGQQTVNKLCAGEPGKDSCSGDSGGPLMVSEKILGRQSFIQQGIVSYGPKHCGSNFPGVYTRVAPYMKWILDHIKP